MKATDLYRQSLAQVADAIEQAPALLAHESAAIKVHWRDGKPDQVTVDLRGKDSAGELERRLKFKFRSVDSNLTQR